MAAEKNFENRIKSWISSRGGWWIKYPATGLGCRAGVPDILACLGGRFCGIEVKAQDGRPSELQLRSVRKIREAGGIACVLYPSGWDRFRAAMSGGEADGLPEIVK